MFGKIPFEQIYYHALTPMDGVPSDLIWKFISFCIPLSLLFTSIIVYLLIKKNGQANIINDKESCPSIILGQVNRFMGKHLLGASMVIVLILLVNAVIIMGLPEFIKLTRASTAIYEEEYIDPRMVTLEFPSKPRNLILLFMESMEVTYTSKEYGGNHEQNLIPNLTRIAMENISFSNGTKVGGTFDYAGFTAPGLFTQMSGLPLRTTLDVNGGAFKNEFFPGAWMMGDILDTKGYRQLVIFGSDAKFGTRDKMFKGHGNFEIFDLFTARERGLIPSDYYVFWGFEDRKLFEYIKMELLELASDDGPFCLVALTVDTHHFDGYVCPLCENDFDEQFSNVIACADKQINAFFSWLQAQPFYNDTTVVFLGDHLSMNASYFQDNTYDRRVYNAFVNSPVVPVNEKDRVFSSLDIFPTILAAMGVMIEGDRLAFGVNLFSDKLSLSQQYGAKPFNYEIRKNSFFYNTHILDPTDYMRYIVTTAKD